MLVVLHLLLFIFRHIVTHYQEKLTQPHENPFSFPPLFLLSSFILLYFCNKTFSEYYSHLLFHNFRCGVVYICPKSIRASKNKANGKRQDRILSKLGNNTEKFI